MESQFSTLAPRTLGSATRQKTTLKDELPGLPDAQFALDMRRERAPERIRTQSQPENATQLWMCLVVKVKSDAVKNNFA